MKEVSLALLFLLVLSNFASAQVTKEMESELNAQLKIQQKESAEKKELARQEKTLKANLKRLGRPFEELSEVLNLTDAQVFEIEDLAIEFGEDSKALQREARENYPLDALEARKEIISRRKAEGLKGKELKTALAEEFKGDAIYRIQVELKENLDDLQVDFVRRVKSALTDQQLDRWDELDSEAEKKAQEKAAKKREKSNRDQDRTN